MRGVESFDEMVEMAVPGELCMCTCGTECLIIESDYCIIVC